MNWSLNSLFMFLNLSSVVCLSGVCGFRGLDLRHSKWDCQPSRGIEDLLLSVMIANTFFRKLLTNSTYLWHNFWRLIWNSDVNLMGHFLWTSDFDFVSILWSVDVRYRALFRWRNFWPYFSRMGKQFRW